MLSKKFLHQNLVGECKNLMFLFYLNHITHHRFFDPKNLGLDTRLVFLSTIEVKICVKIEFSIIHGSHFVILL